MLLEMQARGSRVRPARDLRQPRGSEPPLLVAVVQVGTEEPGLMLLVAKVHVRKLGMRAELAAHEPAWRHAQRSSSGQLHQELALEVGTVIRRALEFLLDRIVEGRDDAIPAEVLLGDELGLELPLLDALAGDLVDVRVARLEVESEAYGAIVGRGGPVLERHLDTLEADATAAVVEARHVLDIVRAPVQVERALEAIAEAILPFEAEIPRVVRARLLARAVRDPRVDLALSLGQRLRSIGIAEHVLVGARRARKPRDHAERHETQHQLTSQRHPFPPEYARGGFRSC